MNPRRVRLACALAFALPIAWSTGLAQEIAEAEAPATSAPIPSPAPSPLPAQPPGSPGDAATDGSPSVSAPLTGLAIYESFRAGMSEPACDAAEARWRRHFSHAPERLGDPDSDTLALFGHVVEVLRDAGLPTEFALIPFVESGYAPGARSKGGPAGLWQFVASTAKHHGIRIEPGYDGRLSPAESTRAAVGYLKTLDDRFDGDWRLAVMAYNAGEYRVLHGLRLAGERRTADHVPGLPAVTYAYVDKLHALACLLEQAGGQSQWRTRLDRPVPHLRAVALENATSLDDWATAHAHDRAALRRLNPALAQRWPRGDVPWALVPDTDAALPAIDPGTAAGASESDTVVPASAKAVATHKVRRGDSAWSIAHRYGLSPRRLLELNDLAADSVLRPGMVLRVE